MDTKAVGERIRHERKSMGVTQEQLANHIGVSLMSIRRYESGNRVVPMDILEKIAEALRATVPYLKYGDMTSAYAPRDDGYIKELLDPGVKSSADLSDNRLREFLDNIPGGFDSFKNEIIKNASPAQKIISLLNILNQEGQQKAVERVEELTEIPKYQKAEAVTTPVDTPDGKK